MEASLSKYLPSLEEDSKAVLKCGEFYKKLESSIFNHVSLGQWEPARASFRCLALSGEPSVRDTCKELLKILILESANYWTASAAVPSPHHLSWLALDTYKSLFPDENDQLPDYIQQLIEFRLLLFQSRGVISFSVKVATALCQYHATHVLRIPSSTSPSPSSYETGASHLPNIIIPFLHDVITILSPTLGHALITSLTVSSSVLQYVHNNESLQFVFVDCINECLEVLDSLNVADTPGNDSDSQYESDHASSGVQLTGTECEKAVLMVYQLLSMLNGSPEMIQLTKKIDTLFHTLLQANYVVGGGGTGGPGGKVVRFEVGRIYGCLLGRSNTFLISRLQEVEEFIRMSNVSDDILLSSSPVSTAKHLHPTTIGHAPHTPHRTSPEEVTSVTDARSTDVVRAEWKNRFYSAMFDRKHFLETALDRGLHLIYMGKLEELSLLMMKPEFVPLRPLLLLLGWDRYTPSGSGKELLDVLWPMEVSMKQSLLYNGCCKLAFQVELVQWCLDKARPHLHSSHSLTFNRAGDMFKGLKNHSTLYVLHHSTPLGALDPLEVVDILKMRPRIPSRTSLLSPPPQFSRGTTPMKTETSEGSLLPGPGTTQQGGHALFSALRHSDLKPEQERDITIFRSFCAMKLIFDAIWSSVELRNASLLTTSREPPSTSTTTSRPVPGATDEPGAAEKAEGGVTSETAAEEKPLPTEDAAGPKKPPAGGEKPHARAARKLDLGSEELKSGLVDGDEDLADSLEQQLEGVQESSPSMSVRYQREVSERLLESRSYLTNIFPLNYRLEVLENIFSLMFLRSEHIRQKSASADQLFTNSNATGVPKSDMSTFVSFLKSRHEFLVDERLALELLEMLLDCIRELRAAKYAQSQQTDASSGEPSILPSSTVRCSIAESALKSRTTKLEQCVNEARWRLQMVSPKQGVISGSGGLGKFEGGDHTGYGVGGSVYSSSETEGSIPGASEESEGEGEEGEGGGSEPAVGKQLRLKHKRPSLLSRADDGSGSISSLSSSARAESVTRSGSVRSRSSSTHRRSVGAGPGGGGGGGGKASPIFTNIGHTPGHTPPPLVLSSTQPAPRPVSFAGLHAQSTPKPKKAVSKQNSLSSLASRPSDSGNRTSSTSLAALSASRRPRPLDEDSGDAADVEERSPSLSTKRPRKKRLHSREALTRRKRRTHSHTFPKHPPGSSGGAASGRRNDDIICWMLASADSLLRMCLRHSNYMRASEVLKILNVEGQLGETLIRFSEQYADVSQQLTQQSSPHSSSSTPRVRRSPASISASSSRSHSTHLSHSNTPPRTSSGTNLTPALTASVTAEHHAPSPNMNLQVAIMNARSSFDPLQCVHQLLAPSSIQQVLFSGDPKLEAMVRESEPLQRLANHVPSLVMLDLACTNKISGQIATKLLEAAMDRLQGDISGSPDSHGPLVLLKFMSDVSSHFTQDSPARSFRQAQSLVPPAHNSPHALLTNSTHILTPAAVYQVRLFQDLYREARENLEAEMDASSSELLTTSSKSPDVFSQLLQLTSPEGKSGSPTSPLRQHTPANGSILDELIRALQSLQPKHALPGKTTPLSEAAAAGGGSVQQPSGGVRTELSYLWHFGRYMSRLMDLLVKCLGIKPSNVGKGSLILSVLSESPSHMLGRLIFEKGIHPQKLEGLMGDFPHLRIVEILIKCCCPQLPSAARPVEAAPCHSPVVPLNVGESSTVVTDPCAFSHQLLSDLLQALKDTATMQSSLQVCVLTTRELAIAFSDPKVQKILSRTPSLASLDLSLLNSLTKQMVFYSNILNCLYAHALMFYCSGAHGMGVAHEEVGVAPASSLGGRGVTISMLESSKVLQTALFSKLGYHVGQLGLISCYDLHHTFLRRGLAPPTLLKDIGLHPRLDLARLDPWLNHAPTSPDPRLFYVLHDGLTQSPQPLPLTVESFETSLTSAERLYLSTHVSIDASKREVTVPKTLFNNRKDFRKLYQADTLSSSQTKSEMPFFRYIQSSIDAKADILLALIEASEVTKSKRLQLVVQPEDTRLGYDFSSQHVGTPSVLSPGGSPRSRRRRLTRDSSRKDVYSPPAATGEGGESRGPPVRRNSLSPETLGFIGKRAPLLGSLVALACPLTSSPQPHPPEEGVAGEEGRDTPTGKDKEEAKQRKSSKALSPSHQIGSGSPRLGKTFDGRDLTPWKRQYNEVIGRFTPYEPLCKFLVARLRCFAELVPWDPPAVPLADSISSSKSPTPESLAFDGTEGVTLRTLALASATSDELAVVCAQVMKKLLETKQIGEAVLFLTSEPAMGDLPEVQFLADMALSCHFIECHRKNVSISLQRRRSLSSRDRDDSRDVTAATPPSVNPVPILTRLSDHELAARLVLSSLEDWPVDVCTDMLSYCLHHVPGGSHLSTPLASKLERMRVYARIMAKCENPMPTSYQWNATRAPWKSWADLAKDSETKTNYVLRVLLESKEFELAREWCQVHGLDSQVEQQIEVDYLFDLLEGGTPNPILAYQKLDSLPDGQASLEVCEALLHEKGKKCEQPSVELTEADLKTIIFVLEYMLSRLSVSIANKSDYCKKLLGAKALLCLPTSAYNDYKQLMQHPFLLVEQLIMDLKIDWASSVIRQLRSNKHLQGISNMDTPILDHTPLISGEDEGVTSDPFSVVLMFYCTKALDFPQPVLIQSTPALLQSVAVTTNSSPTHSGTPRVPQASTRVGAGLDDFGQYPSMTPRRPSGFRTRTGSSTAVPVLPQGEGFQPPSEPPPREKWEKDDETKICRICEVHFGMFMRRHHCRRCGRVVCAGCSAHVEAVKGYEGLVRTCNQCHNLFSPHSSSSGAENAAGGQNVATLKQEGAISVSHAPDVSHPIQFHVLNPLYKLVPSDLLFNQSLRSEFYYERTPNTALCLSLADLLVDKRQAAGVVLDCCHTVSAQLVPDSQGRVNEEIDHDFVIGIIQNLLLNAKLRFADASDSTGVELCDTYLSRVDLLRLLVSARYNKIPSIQELTKPDLARRVRDKLIKADRFGLAMEVSTKCQLDTSAVWSAWGMACLKSGEFPEARSKLKHCFQVTSQSKMMGSGATSGLLQRIVEQIETHPLCIAGRATRFSEDWSGVILGATNLTAQRHSDTCSLDQTRFNECFYYLSTYGTHTSTVSFFMKHSCYREVCRFILDNNCSSDIFVEQLWIPALKTGQTDVMLECMKELDPSLGVWQPHLTAACRLFSQKSLFSVLLLTQICMSDFVRAGLTCIKFFIGFSGRSTTISDLHGRLHYLDQASQHFQTALSSRARPSERGRGFRLRGQRSGLEESGRGGASGIKPVNEAELRGHQETILLQRRVILHLYQSAQAKGTMTDPLGGSGGSSGGADFKSPSTPGAMPLSGGQQPATLFSNKHVRGELATQVIIGSHDLAEGFGIAREIIEHFQLDSRHVLCETARGLALKQGYTEIRGLVQCVQKTHSAKAKEFEVLNDEIIMAAIKVLANQSKEAKQVDKLVQMLITDRSKINGFVLCGKLKNAYLVAIKARMVDEVQRISEIAFKAGQLSVRDICEKWLQTNSAAHRGKSGGR